MPYPFDINNFAKIGNVSNKPICGHGDRYFTLGIIQGGGYPSAGQVSGGNTVGQELMAGTQEELELEKLRQELALLKRPYWKDPKLIGAVVAFVFSAILNVGQLIRAQAESSRSDRELWIKEQQWETNKKQLQLEISKLAQQVESQKRLLARYDQLEEELQRVLRDIAVWDAAVAKDEAEIVLMRQNAAAYDRDGRPHLANGQRKNIEATEQFLKLRKAELERSIQRRREIEQQLGR